MSHFKKRLQLLSYPSLRWYLFSCFVASIGAGLTYISITWMTLLDKNSVSAVAIGMLCFWSPGVLFGPFMGVLVDRYSRRNHLLAASNWIRAIALVIFSYYLFHHHSLIAIYILSFIQGLFFSLFFPAAFRLTREMVPHRKLLYANATIDMMFEGGNIIGMGLAGLLIALMTAAGTLMANAGLFVLAGIALFFIKKDDLNITYNDDVKFNLFQDFKDGLTDIFTNPAILVIYSIQLFVFLEYLTAPVLLAPYARNILHANAAQFGYIEAALSVGAVTGGIFLSWFADRFGLMRTMFTSTIISGIAYVYFSFNHSIVTAEVLYFVLGVCFAMWPLIITRAQHITDIDYQGRVQSCFNSISGILMILTYWGVKIASEYTTIRVLYWLEVLFALISIALIIYFEWRFDEKNEER